MKVRNGFVSNSSSSSFLIYGVIVGDLKGITGNDDDIELDTLIDDKGLDLMTHNPDGEVYVGRSWASVKDDETGKQFKESIEADIIKLFNLTNKPACTTHEYAWQDG